MKNLIEELNELENYNYKVSENFSKDVMGQIKKNKNKNKFNYAVSILTTGAVACLAVIMFTNNNTEKNMLNGSLEYATDNHVASISESKGPLQDISYDDSYIPSNVGKSNFQEMITESDKEECKQGAVNDSLTISGATNRSLIEIAKLIEKAGLDVETSGESVKVKTSKEDIEKILKNYKNLIIEVESEFVIIKQEK